jgi:hypothetical protein
MLVSGHRACVNVDGVTTPYITFEALVEDGWRFDLAGRAAAGSDLESDDSSSDDEEGEEEDED